MAVAIPLAVAMATTHEGHWGFYSLVALSFAGLLCVAINIPRAANLEFLKYTGKISYCLYLVHVPICAFTTSPRVHRLLEFRSPIVTDIVVFIVSIALCYAVAAFSWRFFESKILRLKSRFEFSPAPVSPTPVTIAAVRR
jgi:peptidoglycan/LPS O-acetylase OafA/YrhL